jgi:uncharacterized membrane protein YozB (DUF420 family)
LIVTFQSIFLESTFADKVIPGATTLESVSMHSFEGDSAKEKIESAGFNLLGTAKVVINSLAFIYIVYIGLMMILAYGDEWQLAKQKSQILYALVAFLFVNIPGQIYMIVTGVNRTNQTRTLESKNAQFSKDTTSNIFIDRDFLNPGSWGILGFLQVFVIGVALFYFTIAAFRLLVSGGNEDTLKASKRQALYGILALIFLGVIQVWVTVVYKGDITWGQTKIFAKLANLALFMAGPTAIFFLILGGWFYITSAGDEDKAKRGKNIVINTFIAVIILLASYMFLNDLAGFDPNPDTSISATTP